MNILPVQRARRRRAVGRPISTRPSAAPRRRNGVAERAPRHPARIRALPRAARRRPTTALTGRLYNEYALGSRIQYQVRVGEQVFIVEKLRQQAYRGRLDDEVTIGWDAGDSILVGD